MSRHIDGQSSLFSLFRELENSISYLTHPWSIAELKLTTSEITCISRTVNELSESKLCNFIIESNQASEEATSLQMLGLLLLCLWAENVRKSGTEGSVWPVARKTISDSSPLNSYLFLSNGQPTVEAKELIEKTVTVFNLRNVIDIEGTHEYFETIKLQFGFTYRGAKKRLAEWLVNLGRPHAVQYLLGEMGISELASDSFSGMWNILTQYRRGLITDEECSSSLRRSSWIKDSWIEELLKSAKARIATLGTVPGESSECIPEEDEEESPVEKIYLDWNGTSKPRIIIRLNKEVILDEITGLDINELSFMLDGAKRAQWRKQRNGEWSGKEAFYTDSSSGENPLPLSLTVKSSSGITVKEWNLSDSGLSDDTMVFDLDRDRMIRTGFESIEQTGRYALLYDSDACLLNAEPIAESTLSGSKMKVVMLSSPISENVCIEFNDFVLWQPVKQKFETLEKISISISSLDENISRIGDKKILCVKGVPTSAEKVRLLIGKRVFECKSAGADWTTLDSVFLSSEFLLKISRVMVQYENDGLKSSRIPRILVPVAGVIARMDSGDGKYSFHEVKNSLNKSSPIVDVYILSPGQEKKRVVEGGSQIGFLKYNRMRLSKFNGHGGEVRVKGSSYGDCNTGVIVHDTGIVGKYIPAMLGCNGKLYLNEEKERLDDVNDEYEVYVWEEHRDGSRVRRILKDKIKRKNVFEYEVADNSFPICLAVTYEGEWLGSFVDEQRLCGYFSKKDFSLSEEEHTLIRWFRAPILKDMLFSSYSEVVGNQPRRFLKIWDKKSEVSLPESLNPHRSIDGIPSILRRFLWLDFPEVKFEEIVDIYVKSKNAWKQKDELHHLLEKLSSISPIALWYSFKMMHRTKPEATREYSLKYYLRQINSTSNANDAIRRYKDLLFKLADRTGRHAEDIENASDCFVAGIGVRQNMKPDYDTDLIREVGENILGRQYLAALVSKEWLRLSSGGDF